MSFIPALTVLSKSDIVSSDFWASQFSSFTPASVLLVLICAVITGVIISAVYKITYRGVLYSPQFSMVLIMLVLITAPVVMAIGSNVARKRPAYCWRQVAEWFHLTDAQMASYFGPIPLISPDATWDSEKAKNNGMTYLYGSNWQKLYQ